MIELQQGTRPQLGEDVDLNEIAELSNSYTGADLAGLVRQASFQALKESMTADNNIDTDANLFVNKDHFKTALKHFRPSVSAEVSFLFVFHHLFDYLIINLFHCVHRIRFATKNYV